MRHIATIVYRTPRTSQVFSPQISALSITHFNPLHLRRIHARTMATSKAGLSTHLEALRKYTACDIADALLKLKVPNAGFLPDLTLYVPAPETLHEVNQEITIAPASTVIFAAKDAGSISVMLPKSNIPAGKHWVDLTEPGSIVVMAQPDGQKCAVLGGIMALRIKVLDAKGIVVHGRVRDLVELRETGLPVWAKGTSVVGASAEAKPHAIQVPLNIDGTIVHPGDWVFSDATNGVVVIPQEHLAEVVSLLPNMVEADDRVKRDVSQGSTVQASFKKHRGQ